MKIWYFVSLLMLAVRPLYAQSEALSEEKSQPNAVYHEENDSGSRQRAVDLLNNTMSDSVAESERGSAENLPEGFVANLLQCVPDQTGRTVDGVLENLTIVAPRDNKCRVELALFTLDVPNEMLAKLKTFEDFESLVKDPNIAVLNYQANYRFEGLTMELAKCKEYQHVSHKGRASTEYKYIDVTSVTDITAQYEGNNCELVFVYEITLNGKFMNYNVVCLIPEAKGEELIAPYQQTINLYDSENKTDNSGISDDNMYRIDAKLMYEMQMNGYCRLQEEYK
jgi:hypothetical protein